MVDRSSDASTMPQIVGAIQAAAQTGKIAIGILECMVSVRGGKSRLVIIAEDVEPKRIINELMNICEKKRVPVLVALSRKEIGECSQIDCAAAAVSIENPGHAPSFFQVALRQVGVRPETFHEVMLASQVMLEETTTLELINKMRVSVEALDSLGSPIRDTSTNQEMLSKNLATVLACTLCMTGRLKLDLLQHIDFRY